MSYNAIKGEVERERERGGGVAFFGEGWEGFNRTSLSSSGKSPRLYRIWIIVNNMNVVYFYVIVTRGL